MAYEIETWKRDGAKGESRVHCVRPKNLEDAAAIFAAMNTRGLARITLARSGTSVIWDIWRSPKRDHELDADLRTFRDIRKDFRAKTRQAIPQVA